jgi:hypothetical protein
LKKFISGGIKQNETTDRESLRVDELWSMGVNNAQCPTPELINKNNLGRRVNYENEGVWN